MPATCSPRALPRRLLHCTGRARAGSSEPEASRAASAHSDRTAASACPGSRPAALRPPSPGRWAPAAHSRFGGNENALNYTCEFSFPGTKPFVEGTFSVLVAPRELLLNKQLTINSCRAQLLIGGRFSAPCPTPPCKHSLHLGSATSAMCRFPVMRTFKAGSLSDFQVRDPGLWPAATMLPVSPARAGWVMALRPYSFLVGRESCACDIT